MKTAGVLKPLNMTISMTCIGTIIVPETIIAPSVEVIQAIT